MAGVDLLNLTKRFGAAAVIENLSLTIHDNELVAFLGPSGCGKTTLLRLIAGLETLDAGEIRIGGERVDELAPGQRGVAMVFQNYALYPHMSVRENLAFGLKNARVQPGEIARRIEEAASMLEIAPLLDRKPGALSGGEQQRVAIGRAIVKAPSLFLFDEPMSNLDAALRLRTRLELAELRRRVRAAMIFVTHDQVEAMTLADRIVVMSKSGVEQVGEPMDIYERPATAFVAGFIGAPKINFLPGDLLADSGPFAKVRIADSAIIETRVPANACCSSRVELGLRPDAVRVVEKGQGDADAVVDVVERLGDRTYVYARALNGAKIVSEASVASRLKLGDAVGLKINGSAAHLFDADGRGFHAAAP